MLNNNIKVRENEVVKYDVDNYMDKELSMFQEVVKTIEEDKIKQFRNWVKLFKTLNYDIIDNLIVKDIYRFNKCSAVVELEFNKKTEYDFIVFDETEMMVTIMTVNNGQVNKHIIRRMLIPTTVEEALMYIESDIENEAVDSLAKTYKDLMSNKNAYKISEGLSNHLLSKVDFKSTDKNITENKKETKIEKKEEDNNKINTIEVMEPVFNIENKETKPVNKPVETKKETKPVNKPVETKKETKQFKYNRPLVGVFADIKRNLYNK